MHIRGTPGQSTEVGEPGFLTLFPTPPSPAVGWAGCEVSLKDTGLGVQPSPRPVVSLRSWLLLSSWV